MLDLLPGMPEGGDDLAPAAPGEDLGRLFDYLKRRINEDHSNLEEFKAAARRDFAAYSGERGQWLKEELDALEGVRQPMTINRIQALIDAAVGHEINSRSDITYKPRSVGVTAKNEVLTAGVEHFRDEADAAQEETAAMRSVYICGVGAVEQTMEYDEDPLGRLRVMDHDVQTVGWDWRARRPNLTDAQRAWIVKEMPLSDAVDLFPGVDIGDLDARWWHGHERPEGNGGAYVDLIEDEHDSGLYDGGPTTSSKSVTLIQVEWRRREVRVAVMDPDGGEVEVSEELFQAAQAKYFALTGDELPHVRRKKWVYYKTFLGRKILEHDESPCQSGFSLKFMTGYRDNEKGCFYGLTRNLLGPQTWLNRMLTQLLHIINTNAKGGVMVEEDAVEDPDEFEETWAASDSVAWLEPGSIAAGKIQAKPMPNIPAAISELITLTDSLIYKVSGLSPELLGLSEARVSGVLEHQRRQSSMAVLAAFFDSRKLYLKQVGELMLEFIQRRYIPPEALIRIVGPEGEQAVPLAYARAEETRFDVMVSESPDSPNAKERNWAVMSQMLGLPKVQEMLTPSLWSRIIETSPIPAATIQAIKEEIAASSSPEVQAQEEEEKQFLRSIQERELRLREVEAEATAAERLAKAQSILAQLPGEIRMDEAEAEKDAAYAAIATERARLGYEEEDRRQRRLVEARTKAAQIAIQDRDSRSKRRLDAIRTIMQAQKAAAA